MDRAGAGCQQQPGHWNKLHHHKEGEWSGRFPDRRSVLLTEGLSAQGLMDAAERGSGLASDGHSYLHNPIWWAGMSTMIVGEVANFAAYTFAPPILVTPLGALSVLIGAVLASFILKEELGRLGRVGCTLCLVGTVIIVVNAPEDKEIKTVDEMLNYAIQPCEERRRGESGEKLY